VKKILLLIVSCLLALFIILSIDDELSDETKALLRLTPQVSDSPAFIYSLGMFAASDDNPAVVGKSLLREYQKQALDESYQVNEYPQTQQLPLPTGELFCRFQEDECLSKLFHAHYDIAALNKKHAVLLQRQTTFYDFSEYATLTKPLVIERIPPLQYFSTAVRLQLLNAIELHHRGSSQQAMLDLNTLLSQLRHVLALQDTLIGKMLFLHKLSDVVDVMAVIYQNSDILVDEIANLSVTEKSLSQTFSREFTMHYNTVKGLAGQPEFFKKGVEVPKWIARLVYKPNMTINAEAPFFTRLVQMSGFSHIQFVTEIAQGNEVDLPPISFRNYLGSVLANIAMPSFDSYIARILDFDAKLVLLNHLDKDLAMAPNPYYKKAIPIISDDKICFEGPLEDNHFIRCLRTNISP